MNIAQLIVESLSRAPAREAIRETDGKSITCAGLAEKITFYRRYFKQKGLNAGERVVLQFPIGIELFALTMGLIAAGGVPVLLDPGYGDKIYLSQAQAARPRWVLVHPAVLAVHTVPGLRSWLRRRGKNVPVNLVGVRDVNRLMLWSWFIKRTALQDPGSAGALCQPRLDDDEAAIVFTGGTTGDPKGVRMTHGGLRHYLAQVSAVVHGAVFNRLLAENLQQVLYAIFLGKPAIMVKSPQKDRARLICQLIKTGRADAFFGSPHIWIEIFNLTPPSSSVFPAGLKAVYLGGAPVTPLMLKMLAERLHPDTSVTIVYGMTETGPVCTISARNKLAYTGNDDLVGSCVGSASIAVSDPEPDTGIGEVLVSGPSIFRGYIGEKEGGPKGPFPTGDLGRMITVDGKRMLTLLGRKKDMIIRRGVNIYPTLIEPLIMEAFDSKGQRAIRECALVGVWNEKLQDEEVVLFVQPDDSIPWDETRMKILVNDICGNACEPDHIFLTERIPKTGRQNKIDKQELRREAFIRLRVPDSMYRKDAETAAR